MDDGSRNIAPAPSIDEATIGQTEADALRIDFYNRHIADHEDELAQEDDPEIRQALINGIETLKSAREKHVQKMAAKVTEIVSSIPSFTPEAVANSTPIDAAKNSDS